MPEDSSALRALEEQTRVTNIIEYLKTLSVSQLDLVCLYAEGKPISALRASGKTRLGFVEIKNIILDACRAGGFEITYLEEDKASNEPKISEAERALLERAAYDKALDPPED